MRSGPAFGVGTGVAASVGDGVGVADRVADGVGESVDATVGVDAPAVAGWVPGVPVEPADIPTVTPSTMATGENDANSPQICGGDTIAVRSVHAASL